jgi:hypothetical protein
MCLLQATLPRSRRLATILYAPLHFPAQLSHFPAQLSHFPAQFHNPTFKHRHIFYRAFFCCCCHILPNAILPHITLYQPQTSTKTSTPKPPNNPLLLIRSTVSPTSLNSASRRNVRHPAAAFTNPIQLLLPPHTPPAYHSNASHPSARPWQSSSQSHQHTHTQTPPYVQALKHLRSVATSTSRHCRAV